MRIHLIMCVFLQKYCCHELKRNRNFCEIFIIFTKFLFYFIIIHQLHALSHKTKKIYAKSTLRDSNVFVNKDFQENHFFLFSAKFSRFWFLAAFLVDFGPFWPHFWSPNHQKSRKNEVRKLVNFRKAPFKNRPLKKRTFLA